MRAGRISLVGGPGVARNEKRKPERGRLLAPAQLCQLVHQVGDEVLWPRLSLGKGGNLSETFQQPQFSISAKICNAPNKR
jgi:hypothetical protein